MPSETEMLDRESLVALRLAMVALNRVYAGNQQERARLQRAKREMRAVERALQDRISELQRASRKG